MLLVAVLDVDEVYSFKFQIPLTLSFSSQKVSVSLKPTIQTPNAKQYWRRAQTIRVRPQNQQTQQALTLEE